MTQREKLDKGVVEKPAIRQINKEEEEVLYNITRP